MYSQALVLSDLHVCFESKAYISIATKLIKQLKPDYVCQIGDAIDAGSISTYPQDPANRKHLIEEINAYNKILDTWQSVMKPGSTFHQCEGNHCDRLSRLISRNCGDIHDLIKPIPEMLRFKERSKSGIKFIWHPLKNWKSLKIADVYIHHGTFYDKNLAVSNLSRYQGIKFIQGHSHRYQSAYANGVWSVSLGHGSNADKTNHIPGPNTWQTAMGLIHIIDGKGHFEPIIIDGDRTCFRGKTIKA